MVQRLLQGGLVLSAAAMLTGLIFGLATAARAAPAVPLFDLLATRSAADTLMAVGVLALAVTPVLRVLSLLVLWARARDWRFAAVALLVVLLLSSAVLLGHG